MKRVQVGHVYEFSVVMAQALREMAEACERERYREGLRILDRADSLATETYPYLEDEDITRVLDMVRDYRSILRDRIRRTH